VDRPRIICHMMASLDGKSVGDFLLDEQYSEYMNQYFKLGVSFGSKVRILGRATFSKLVKFGEFNRAIEEITQKIPRTDYVVDKNAEKYLVAIDSSGKLNWDKSHFAEDSENPIKEHIIEVLTEKVSDAYLASLQKAGVSYIFGGKETLDLTLVVKKLKKLFSFDTLVLEGGGTVNGSFLNEGLVDEVSLLIVPVVDGTAKSKTIFETEYVLKTNSTTSFALNHVEKTKDDGLWLKYSLKRD